MTILVTGSTGMIGSSLVRALIMSGYDVVGLSRNKDSFCDEHYFHHTIDLGDKDALIKIKEKYQIDRIIHLAALAHTVGLKKSQLTDEVYYRINVENSRNIFQIADNIPVLFISTVDVYGFVDGVVGADSPLNPVTIYGKTKMMAENECKLLPNYTIFRLSPVYTDDIKRDIQKRYYLKPPVIAYTIGSNTEYEILDVKKAVSTMVEWVSSPVNKEVRILKDEKRMKPEKYIEAEKKLGRAKIVLHFPKWTINLIYVALKKMTGKNKYTYLLNKAVNPLRTE